MADEPNAELLQKITSHPEFGKLLQQLLFNPTPMTPGIKNLAPGNKDQSRVVSAPYPGDR